MIERHEPAFRERAFEVRGDARRLSQLHALIDAVASLLQRHPQASMSKPRRIWVVNVIRTSWLSP